MAKWLKWLKIELNWIEINFNLPDKAGTSSHKIEKFQSYQPFLISNYLTKSSAARAGVLAYRDRNYIELISSDQKTFYYGLDNKNKTILKASLEVFTLILSPNVYNLLQMVTN